MQVLMEEQSGKCGNSSTVQLQGEKSLSRLERQAASADGRGETGAGGAHANAGDPSGSQHSEHQGDSHNHLENQITPYFARLHLDKCCFPFPLQRPPVSKISSSSVKESSDGSSKKSLHAWLSTKTYPLRNKLKEACLVIFIQFFFCMY